VARILIVGGGCRGRGLASELVGRGHVVRVSTRTEDGRAAIEAAGAECWIGTPDRLATMRAALDRVAILCWLLASAAGSEHDLRELHTSRLRFFLTQAIDTTVRGFVYEAGAAASSPGPLAAGERIARALTAQNAIPAAFLTSDPRAGGAWLAEALGAIDSLLSSA
jgi:uncharacterized protein YbjT (DUF2867 family)